MKGAIAIFVKTPGLSPVKTRLAVKLGQEIAESFHLASAKTVADVVQLSCETEDLTGYFAVAEEEALDHNYWEDLPCILQGGGGLGERMAHIYHSLLSKYDFVILIGADIPQMSSADLLQAASWLSHSEQARLAFAPSDDGGFWLFGGNCPIPHTLWGDVVYSVEDTGKQFLKHIEQYGEVKILNTLRDIDELEDLIPLRESLTKLPQAIPAQHALIHFLDTVLPETA